SRWLAKPLHWDHNRGDPAVSDKGLARLQWAAALVEALDARQLQDRDALVKAAELVRDLQKPDGAWRGDGGGTGGSPATYGTSVATAMARRTLVQADHDRFREAIARADRWLREVPIRTVLDAAAILLGLEEGEDREAAGQRNHCSAVICKGQGKEGGWGP